MSHAALAWSCGPIAFFLGFFAGAMVVAVEGQKFITLTHIG